MKHSAIAALLCTSVAQDCNNGNGNDNQDCNNSGENTGGSGGASCFHGESTVRTQTGTKLIKDLQPGELVQVMTDAGNLQMAPVLFQLHADNTERGRLSVMETSLGHKIRLTDDHLIFVSQSCLVRNFTFSRSIFAGSVQEGDCVYVSKSEDGLNNPDIDLVEKVTREEVRGLYAPVTQTGTIIVDHIVASCYAYVESHRKAHNLFSVFQYMPEKGWKNIQAMFQSMTTEGMAKWLLALSHRVSYDDERGTCFKNSIGQQPMLNVKPRKDVRGF